nr:uncharacterized protein LOC122174068 [Chrysemys picta bellii]
MRACGQACQTETQNAAGLARPCILPRQGPPGLGSDCPGGRIRLPVVVAVSDRGLRRHPLCCTTAGPGACDGRVRPRMGCSSRGPQDSGLVVGSGAVAPYQCEGAQDGSFSLSDFSRHFECSQRDSSDGQHDRYVLHVLTALPRGSPPLGLLHSPRHSSRGVTSPGGAERTGRPPQQVVPHARVDAQSGCCVFAPPQVGVSPGRPVCHQGQCPVPAVLLVPGPQPGLNSRCIRDPVGREIEIRLPPASPGAQGPAQGAQGWGSSHPHRPGLALPALVYHAPGAVGGSPGNPAPTPGPHHAGRRAAPPLRPAITASNGMEALWLNALKSQCSLPMQQVLLGSRKPSTRATYLAKWKRFSCWCGP